MAFNHRQALSAKFQQEEEEPKRFLWEVYAKLLRQTNSQQDTGR